MYLSFAQQAQWLQAARFANAVVDKEGRFKAEHSGSAFKKGEVPARACLRFGRRLLGFLAAP